MLLLVGVAVIVGGVGAVAVGDGVADEGVCRVWCDVVVSVVVSCRGCWHCRCWWCRRRCYR